MLELEDQVETAKTSMMERLREKRQQAMLATTVDLPIPGYGGELHARYRLLDPLVEGKEISERIVQQFKGDEQSIEFYGLVDSLIVANEGFYYRDEEGSLQLLDPDGTGPMTYSDPRLAEFLDIEMLSDGKARATIVGVFAGNKVALSTHGQRFQRWMADPAGDARLGES